MCVRVRREYFTQATGGGGGFGVRFCAVYEFQTNTNVNILSVCEMHN